MISSEVGMEDGQLVGLALERRRGGATGLVTRYRPGVMSHLRRLVGDQDLASDLAQDVFLQVFRNLSGLREPQLFGAWLGTIVRRTFRGWLRATGARTGRRAVSLQPSSLDEIPGAHGDPFADCIENSDIWWVVGHLPDPYRLTLIQRFREDLPLASIAQRQRIGLPLAKFRLRRGLKLLREQLARPR